jgi:hypothetical protein
MKHYLQTRFDVDDAVKNSFRDFHAKGFDYICIKRSPEETLKLYFFDGDVAKLPDVVAPHDHRYDFESYVVHGAMQNSLYDLHPRGEEYERFNFDTPLNGGKGFTWRDTVRVLEMKRTSYFAGHAYFIFAHEYHTIRILQAGTVLLLRQRADVMAVGEPTSTFIQGSKEPPVLDGLYKRFTADQLIAKLGDFEQRTGIKLFDNKRRCRCIKGNHPHYAHSGLR